MATLTHGKHVAEEELSLYAVRALVPERNAEAQHHLDICIKCRGRLAEIISGLSLLALTSSPDAPAKEAREFLLSRIKTEAALETTAEEKKQIEIAAHLSAGPRSWLKGPGWIAAAIAILFAIYLGSTRHTLEHQVAALRYKVTQLSGETLQAQQATSLLNSHTAQWLDLRQPKAASHPTAQIIYDKTHAALILIASHLDPLPANRTYILWLVPVSGTPPIRIALFRPDTQGNASIALPPLPAGIDARTFGVTMEEAQDSTIPALPFILSEE